MRELDTEEAKAIDPLLARISEVSEDIDHEKYVLLESLVCRD